MEEIDLQNEKEVMNQISIARKWALEHFNAKNCHNTKLVDDDMNFLKPSFFVEFPTVDTMIVWPSILGKKHFIQFKYRLAFNPLEWHGKYDINLPLLKIDKLKEN